MDSKAYFGWLVLKRAGVVFWILSPKIEKLHELSLGPGPFLCSLDVPRTAVVHFASASL